MPPRPASLSRNEGPLPSSSPPSGGGPGRGPALAALKVRALKWLAQREHSRSELRAKLLRLAARPPEGDDAPADAGTEIDALLDWLAARGYLSDVRFVESRVNARQARYGNLRIRDELRRHGTALDAGTEQTLQATEFERAREVWARKFGAAATDAAARVRQMRFLLGRGFSPEVVRRVVRALPLD